MIQMKVNGAEQSSTENQKCPALVSARRFGAEGIEVCR
jgi:hypothetical protein